MTEARHTDETLNEALASLGLTTRPSPFYGRKIISDRGVDLGIFDASEGWDLVRKLRAETVVYEPYPGAFDQILGPEGR